MRERRGESLKACGETGGGRRRSGGNTEVWGYDQQLSETLQCSHHIPTGPGLFGDVPGTLVDGITR